ncbi:MAG: DUF262 domain-containing protein [Planctomycetes bacterium]|nr:DUF262 domain-containing protein [Planctomycetota bacterium]
MAATNFKTENNTFRKLLGNGLTYRVPRFQRDYSWTEEEWEDLWQDLLGTLRPDGEPAHYMGYLVLQSSDDRSFDVIDGQQRLTTLSVLVLAVLKGLQRLVDAGQEPENNQRRIDQIRNAYIGYLDPVTLVPRPKLALNRNNDNYYQAYLVPLAHLPTRGLRASEHLLRKAYEWFDRRIGEHVAKASHPGRALAEFVEAASDRLFFTVITVTDELNAYKVFETLNARGVQLSATDLLKNYLFAVLDRQPRDELELRSLEERWEAMVGRLGAESFPDFLRVHWNSRRTYTRQSDLFKTIRSVVKAREQVFRLLREMEEDLDTYLSLSSPETSAWTPTEREHVATLGTFGVRQSFSMLLAARRQLGAVPFEGLLRACVVISLRYNVICGFSTGEQESVYGATALRIAKGEIRCLPDALAALQPVYPADTTFQAAFAEKVIRTTQSRNHKVVRLLLCAIERHLATEVPEPTSDTFTVEHVLPQNPGPGWRGFSDAEAEAMVYRLGNMTLLHRDANSQLGNDDHARKRPVLAASSFALSRRLAAEYADWGPEHVAARQRWLATQAAAIWRIAQFG